jgi:hypothetical protein
LTIPYQFKHLAMGLSDVMGLPLSFDVQLWSPAAAHMTRDAGA